MGNAFQYSSPVVNPTSDLIVFLACGSVECDCTILSLLLFLLFCPPCILVWDVNKQKIHYSEQVMPCEQIQTASEFLQ